MALHSHAQQFGGHPPSHKWKQINTDSARIIFPAGADSMAQRVAAIVHQLASRKPISLGDRLKKINIVLQNKTTIPNGYVGLGPFRSEFFLTPFPGNFEEGSVSWTELLALHEYRHVQQFNNFYRGLSRLMYFLFGEEGYSLAINAAIPGWFYEGDAVYIETLLSEQGRGRLPLFTNAFPALWQEGKNYSWMKLRNGSLKDYVPNHYYLGYLLVNYGVEKYGPDFWKKVTQDASAFKGLFYPFQQAIKRHTGKEFKDFRKAALEFYRERSMKKQAGEANEILPANKKYVSSYFDPQNDENGRLIYQKNSYRHRPAFYIRDSSGERRLKVRDISLEDQFSYGAGKIVYSAYARHPRWGWQDYSVIKMLDIESGKERKLTNRSKYFTPDISPSGTQVAAVQIEPNGKSELHLLSSADGRIVKRIHSSEIMLFTDPKYIDDSSLVMAVRLKDGKMALALVESETGNLFRLTPPSFNVLGSPAPSNDIIYFTASFGGNDDVFALKMSDRKLFRITNGPLGNYFVYARQNELTWSAFTAEGYQLRKATIDPAEWTEVSMNEVETLIDPFPVSRGGEFGAPVKYIPAREFGVTDYKKTTGFFNFHSWRPYYSDPIFTFSVYGENILNTLQTEIYYQYHLDDRTSGMGFNAVYGGFFPYLNLGGEYTFERSDSLGNRLRHWDQLDTYIGLTIPLNSASGKTFKSFRLGSNYVLRNEFNKGFHKDSIGNNRFSYLHHFISWSAQVQSAVQHIYPRLGYGFSANHRHAITDLDGYQLISNAHIYLPGLLSNHSVVLTGSFQQRDTLSQVVYSNRFAYSRGYTGRYFSRMWRLSGNYNLPIFYPDWGFANILYFQRLRGNLFFDFTKIYSRDKTITRDQRSVGIELMVDTKWWNEYPLSFGVRFSHLLDPDQFDGWKGTILEFILPVSIIPR